MSYLQLVALCLTSTGAVRTFLRLAYGTHLAQVAELVDALVSGTSGAIRGGSSPLLGTIKTTCCARFLVSFIDGTRNRRRTRSRPYRATLGGSTERIPLMGMSPLR